MTYLIFTFGELQLYCLNMRNPTYQANKTDSINKENTITDEKTQFETSIKKKSKQ